MDEQTWKSIQKSASAIFRQDEKREKAGEDYFETGRQATLERYPRIPIKFLYFFKLVTGTAQK